MNTKNEIEEKNRSQTTDILPSGGASCSASSVDHAKILRTWEDSLKDMQSRIRVEQNKEKEANIRASALQEEYWKLEGRLDVAKELVRKQSLPNV
jgi:cysteine sulfinate desulfinase/cysteine desulfurase-like protein